MVPPTHDDGARPLPGSESDVRHRLLDAASEEFAEKGYEGATVREIVARAHANLNSVNYYFGSKQALYVEVMRHQVALSEAAHPLLVREPPAGDDPAAALRAAVRRLVTFLLDPHSLLPRLYALELVNPSPAFESAGGNASHQSALTGAVRALLGPDADPRLVARCVRTVYSQCAYFMFVRKVMPRVDPGFQADARTIEEITDHITEFSLGGLARLRPTP
jgi:TetR/AcrR family transcriptional regulator, regulator of cefoperazone and chloramphenicol sensitivity